MKTFKGIFYIIDRALSDWDIIELLALGIGLLIMVSVIQLIVNINSFKFKKAYSRIKAYLKRYKNISTRYMYFFNKKVTKVFDKNIQKQAVKYQKDNVDLNNFCMLFENIIPKKPKNILKTAYVVVNIALACIMAMSGYGIAMAVYILILYSVLWLFVAIADILIKAIFSNIELKSRKKFLYLLEHNVVSQAKEISLDFDDNKAPVFDSVQELAQEVKDFLATNPNKSLAKVVLKSLYSANFACAMNDKSIADLRNCMLELKNYTN